jgi:Tfp pilus assembly protein PilN
MIQFNLLPDVKLEYMKLRRTRRLIIMIAVLAAGVALAIFISLFLVVNVWQWQHLRSLNSDIKKDTATLQSIPDLNKILTVQNQLNSLTGLHEKDPAAGRLFDYLGQVTPAQASVSDVKIDFTTNTLNIGGNANSLSTVNQYVDTLKFTTFTTNNNSTPQKAFSEVVLSSFTVLSGAGKSGVTYQINLKFNPTIFDNTLQVQLSVPKIISTRSETEKPTDLFQPKTGSGQ